MGRYGTPVFLSEREILNEHAILTGCVSWVGHFVVAIFLLGWVVAALFFAVSSGFSTENLSVFKVLFSAVAIITVGGIGLICLIAGTLFLSSAFAAMRSSNWTIRVAEAGIYLKLRSYVDYRLSGNDKIVVFIPRSEIRQIRSTLQKSRVVLRGRHSRTANDDQMEKQDFLEIELYGHDLSEIERCLEDEKMRASPTFFKGVTSRAKGAAIRIHSGGILKLDWKTRKTRMQPKMPNMLAVLSEFYATSALEEEEQISIKSLNKEQQENRLIELAQTGNVMDAVILSRELYDMDLTQAKLFVDDLLERPAY